MALRKEVSPGCKLRAETSKSVQGILGPRRTKGISDVLIDTCPSRKWPFTWTTEAGKGKWALWEEAVLPAPWESDREAGGGGGSWEALGTGPEAPAGEASPSDSTAGSGLPVENCVLQHGWLQPAPSGPIQVS